jgi:TfoX/Sxy family transcriptional regulator of competence genes
MAHDEGVAQRLREAYPERARVVEKKMFGGIAFMVSGHMSCGVVDDTLMVRVGPAQYEQALKKPHARKMDFTGKPLNGFVYVAPAGFESDEDLASWVKLSMSFVSTLQAKPASQTRPTKRSSVRRKRGNPKRSL